MAPPLAFLFDAFSSPEIGIIGFVALLLFGGKGMPEFARGFGKVMRELRKATSEVEREFKRAMDDVEHAASPPAARPIVPTIAGPALSRPAAFIEALDAPESDSAPPAPEPGHEGKPAAEDQDHHIDI